MSSPIALIPMPRRRTTRDTALADNHGVDNAEAIRGAYSSTSFRALSGLGAKLERIINTARGWKRDASKITRKKNDMGCILRHKSVYLEHLYICLSSKYVLTPSSKVSTAHDPHIESRGNGHDAESESEFRYTTEIAPKNPYKPPSTSRSTILMVCCYS